MKNLILLDSNFILIPIQFNIDIYEEIINIIGNVQFIILSEVINELYKKTENKSQTKFCIELKKSLELLNQKRELTPHLFTEIKKTKKTSNVDNFIIEIAKDLRSTSNNIKQANGIYIASNDKNLRRKARKDGIHTIFMRQRSKIEFD